MSKPDTVPGRLRGSAEGWAMKRIPISWLLEGINVIPLRRYKTSLKPATRLKTDRKASRTGEKSRGMLPQLWVLGKSSSEASDDRPTSNFRGSIWKKDFQILGDLGCLERRFDEIAAID
jgi:hypothetical protein